MELTPDNLKQNKGNLQHIEMAYSTEDSGSSDNDSDDDDYEDKYVERKMKSEGNLNGIKRRSSGEDAKVSISLRDHKEMKAVEIKEEEPSLTITPTIKDEVEREFLARLNQFMSERAYPYPKQFWMGLRDG